MTRRPDNHVIYSVGMWESFVADHEAVLASFRSVEALPQPRLSIIINGYAPKDTFFESAVAWGSNSFGGDAVTDSYVGSRSMHVLRENQFAPEAHVLAEEVFPLYKFPIVAISNADNDPPIDEVISEGIAAQITTLWKFLYGRKLKLEL